MNELFVVGEQHFDLVVTRADGVSIYRGDDRYLRIGPADELDEEIAIQRRMLDAGFPVPDLIETGEHKGLRYAIESSLGLDTLGDRFDVEVPATGSISPGGSIRPSSVWPISSRHILGCSRTLISTPTTSASGA